MLKSSHGHDRLAKGARRVIASHNDVTSIGDPDDIIEKRSRLISKARSDINGDRFQIPTTTLEKDVMTIVTLIELVKP